MLHTPWRCSIPHRGGATCALLACCVVGVCGIESRAWTEAPPPSHPPARSPAEAVSLFEVPEGLNIELVVSEPDLSQPLSISFDDRGRLWVLQYLQYPIPEGRAPVEVDQYLRTKYDTFPDPPPRGPKGRDRISIHADTDGDGRIDAIKHFISDLNLASGMALGDEGVFVVQPPYLLFYPDRDRDDVPDSDPEVLLTGFGLEDPHAFANSLTWGPDGWLYGAQGSTVTADIRGIGFQQGIWRYHPRTKEFELFSEGGGNTWGIDFDRHGNLFAAGNTAEPMLHHVQGGYYAKTFGKHGPLHNPHTYGYFRPVTHEGFLGAGLTGGFVLYQGGAFPERFNNASIYPNGRQSASRWSTLETRGTTFTSRFAGDFITTSDIWFRPVDSTVGPDGALYVADWYDYNISHSNPQNRGTWYAPSRNDGRVWRVAPADVERVPTDGFDLSRRSSADLVELLSHPNDWYPRQARRILAERRDTAVVPSLRSLLRSNDQRLALQALWSLYVSGAFDEGLAAETLGSPHAYVRAWSVRLLGDARSAPPPLHARFVQMARDDESAIVRSQLACTAKRLPGEQALPIIEELLRHSADVGDPHIPLLIWWAIESKALSDREAVLQLANSDDAWRLPLMREFILERLARRYAAEGTAEDFAACVRLLDRAPDDADVDLLVKGFVQALSGRRYEAVPAPLEAALNGLLGRRAADANVLELAVRLGSRDALDPALRMIGNSAADQTARMALIKTLGEVRAPQAIERLFSLLDSPQTDPLHEAVVAALGFFDDPRIAGRVLQAYPGLAADSRSRAIELLCSRREGSVALLRAVADKRIDPAVVSMGQLRQMLEHGDERVEKLITAQWGRVQPATTLEKNGLVTALLQKLSRVPGDAAAGHPVFEKTCANCHKLHGLGAAAVGPDLTGADRKDREVLLRNIVDPSAVIRQEYIAQVAVTVDGRVLTGLLAESTDDTITILDAQNKRTVLGRGELDALRESPLSLMPERLLEPLTDQQIRDLIAYLQSDGAPAAAASE